METKNYLLGIDIGTYSSKGVLIDYYGNIISSVEVPHTMLIPKKGWAEHDAEETWWGDFCKISKALIQDSDIDPKQISGIGCSAIGPDLLPVDEECRPLRKGILYGIDTRSTKEIAYLENLYGKDYIFKKCGNTLSTQAVGPKILWLKNNEGTVYENAYKFVSATTYIVAKLTDNFIVDHYSASNYHPLYDYNQNQWSEEMAEHITDISKLPNIAWTTDIAGTVTPKASNDTGLAVGTPVIVGTIDAAAEAVSVGVVDSGNMMLMYGTTQFMINVTDKPVTDIRLWSAPYLFPNTYAVMGGMATSGAITVWFRDNFTKDLLMTEADTKEKAFSALAETIKSIPAGSDGLIVLPYFSGERTPINNPNAKGVIFGLSLIHTREHIYKAILEGIGYAISHHLEVFEITNVDTNRIKAVGGGTKNKTWLQIVSDICGYKQEVPNVTIGASYGDAFLAGLGIGVFNSRNDINYWVKSSEEIIPDKNTTNNYKEHKEKYHKLYYSTKELMN